MREIQRTIRESISLKELLLRNEELLETILNVSNVCTLAYKGKRKLLFCGNGGSAADAQHLAAEMLGRFYSDRDPLPAEALHVNTSYLTAVANDYDFSQVFSRMVKAKGQDGDVLFAISTSGNSPNVIEAAKQARKQGIITVGLTGSSGGNLKSHVDYLINVPSDDTPRIQEAHILIGHIICERIEKNLFP